MAARVRPGPRPPLDPEPEVDLTDAVLGTVDPTTAPAPPPPIRSPKAALNRLREEVGDAGLLALGLLFGLTLVERFDFTAFGVFSPDIRDTFHLSNAGIDAIVNVASVLPIFLSVPIGVLADRRDRVRLSQIGAFVWALTAVATGLAPVVLVLVFARLLGGVGLLVNEPVHPSLLSDLYPAESLPTVLGAHRFGAATGGVVAGVLAGGLGAVFGWRAAFVILAVPTVVLAAALSRIVDPGRVRTQTERSDMLPEQADKVPVLEAYRRLAAVRSLRRTWAAAFFFGAGVAPFTAYLSLFYEDVFHLHSAQRGVFISVFGVGALVGLVVGTASTAKAARDDLALLPVVNGLWVVEFAAGIFLLAITPWLPLTAVFSFAAGLGSTAFLPAYLTMVARVVPAKLRSQAFAWTLLFFAGGALGLGIFVGSLADSSGYRVSFVFLALLVGIGGATEVTARSTVARDVEQAAKNVSTAASDALLACRGVDVAYDNVQVLFGVDFEVSEGEIVALLGTNGAGKSTLLRAISGLLDPIGGAIFFDGRDVTHADAVATASLGMAQVPGGRGVFPLLTVAENLKVAGWLFRRDAEYLNRAIEDALGYFPVLRQRWNTPAGNLSGGEQQMLTLAQAFIAKPKLLMIDELSLGLAPVIVEQLLGIVRAIRDRGATIILVEQSVNVALTVAERAYFLEKGEIRFHGPTRELLDRPDVLRSVFLEGAASRDANGAASQAAKPARARRRLRRREAVLEVRGVTRSFGGVTALSDVTLDLRRGEILGIIGPNGAGKTTLFDVVSGFLPARGRVVLGGEDVSDLPAEVRARMGLGRSFQDARLFPALTVSETIAVALERKVAVRDPVAAALRLPAVSDSEAAVQARVDELIELMGLQAFRDKFVSELSTGSRRVVDLACILAHEPTVLLLDEPSSGIAQRETEALGPLLLRIREQTGASLLVIEHDMPLITSIADELLALDLGRVVTRGEPDEVVRHPAVVESYLGSSEEVIKRSGRTGRRRRR